MTEPQAFAYMAIFTMVECSFVRLYAYPTPTNEHADHMFHMQARSCVEILPDCVFWAVTVKPHQGASGMGVVRNVGHGRGEERWNAVNSFRILQTVSKYDDKFRKAVQNRVIR